MRRILISLIVLAATPCVVFAAGNDETKPPEPTATTTQCTDGQVWDEATKACTDAKDARLDDDMRYAAVRELAYAGRYSDALTVIAAMSDQNADRVLTYKGFVHRKSGQIEQGTAFYERAIKANPDNILARSYLGQGLVEQGEIVMAEAELAQIRARGGAGTWAEIALQRAISTGVTASY